MYGYGYDDPGYAEWLEIKAMEAAEEAEAAAQAEAMAELEEKEREAMAEHEIAEMLDLLEELRRRVDLLESRKREAINAVMTDEIRKQIEDIEAEFGEKIDAIRDNMSDLEKRIKERVIGLGKSVRGTYLQASLSSRVSWDTKRLEGYARAHPEVLQFRRKKVFVSIRNV